MRLFVLIPAAFVLAIVCAGTAIIAHAR